MNIPIRSVRFDYYGPMIRPHRLRTIAIAAVFVAAIFAGLTGRAYAGTEKHTSRNPTPDPADMQAALDAELFYDILLGELSLRSGDPGAAYALMLEAARRSGDEQLYRRAADIALQARSGDYALKAVQAWKEAHPESREANRYLLQILVALNRIEETPQLLRQELAQASANDKNALLLMVPQLYARASDKTLAAQVVEQALSEVVTDPATAPAAWVAIGRMRLAAKDYAGALAAAQRAQELAPTSDGAMLLALELLENGQTQAQALVDRYLAGQPKAELRMAYAGLLLNLQRNAEAEKELQAVTRAKPDFPDVWLLLAALQLQKNQLNDTEKSLQRFLELLDKADVDAATRQRGQTQAYLMYAQIAEKRHDYAAAESWLKRIDNAQDMFSVQRQRASVLAHQGKIEQARALLRNLPGATPQAARLKLQAEVQLLQEMQMYREAYEVQSQLVAQNPQDDDLVYDLALLAEKAGKPQVMEKLLRELIARRPDYYHAYNALGYSLADRGVQLEEAKRLISKALEFAPGDPYITDSLGWVEFRLGRHDEALRLLESAYKTRPDAEIAAHLGEVLWSMGERHRALSIWKEGRRLNPDNETLQSTLKRLGVRL